MRWTRFGRKQAEARWGLRVRSRAGGLGMGSLVALVASIAAVMVLGAASASAEPLCTDSWTGPSEGEWATAGDWSTGKVPTSTDVACVGAEKTVNVYGGTNQVDVLEVKGTLDLYGGSLEIESILEASNANSLKLEGGTLSGAGTLNVSSSLALNGGTLSGSGSLVVESGASGTVGNDYDYIDEHALVNDGTVTMASGLIEMEKGAAITNSGTFKANSEWGTVLFRVSSGGGTASFVNSGTFEKTAGEGEGKVSVNFENSGAVRAESGILTFNDGGSSSGSNEWRAAEGKKINFRGGSFAFAGGKFLGSTNIIAGATISFTGTPTVAQISVETGTLGVASGTTTVEHLTVTSSNANISGSGTLEVTDSFVWEGGTMSGSGATVLGSAASTMIEPGYDYLIERPLINNGILTMSAGLIEMEKGASITNSGTFKANSEWGTVLFRVAGGGGSALFINNGEFEKTSGEGTGKVAVNFENNGTIQALTGKLEIRFPVAAEASTTFGPEGRSYAQPNAKCGDPVSCATGNYTETATDFSIGGRGVGLDLTRTYNSQAAAEGVKGVFGYGWTSSFSDYLVVNKETKTTTLHQANGSTVPFAEESGGAFKAPVWTQETLSGTEGAGYTLLLADQIKYKFAGSSGRLESVTDRDGNATTLTYNGSGQLTTITDPVSRTIKLTYNGEGLVESAEDPMKHVVKYTYESGNLKSVTQPGETGLRWQFKYDGSHRMTEMVDGRGGKTINEYNGSSQVTKQEDPAGRKLEFEYEPFHTKITNETTGSVTNEYFTSNDEPSSITRGYGTASATTESFTYNAGGYVTSVTDGNGHTTKYGYDSANDRTSMVDPDSDETKWTYDSTHDVETETTPKGETTTIKRESHGNPEVVERPAPESKTQVTKYKYTAHGELESVTNPLENVWKYEYDSKGDRTAETDPEGNKRTWEYNEDSQVTAEVSPRGNIAGGKPESFKTKFERNAEGLPLKITDPLGHTTEYKYDGDTT